MAKRTPSDICNVAIVGHGGVGKTTFVDHLLHSVGFAKRAGDVDAGSSLSDYDPEEKERQFSINSTVFHFQAHDRTFNLIDTPGYLDFVGAALAALPVVETAVIAVSAHDGIQLNTRRMWQAAGEEGLARVLLITRLDSDNVDFDGLVGELQENLGVECRPVFLPIGLGKDVKGVVNLLTAEEAPEGVIGDFESAGQGAKRSAARNCSPRSARPWLPASWCPSSAARPRPTSASRSARSSWPPAAPAPPTASRARPPDPTARKWS